MAQVVDKTPIPLRWIIPCLFLVSLWAPRAVEATEYRLRVVSLAESAFTHFVRSAPGDTAAAPELERLVRLLDNGGLPPGVILFDRSPQAAPSEQARAFDAVSVQARSDPRAQWTELVWEGEPGQRSLFRLNFLGRQSQELCRLAVKGAGPLRYLEPLISGFNGKPSMAVGMPLDLIRFWEGRSGLWSRWVGPHVDLGDGIAVVRGLNSSPVFPDQAFIVVEQGPTSAVFTAILAWRNRGASSSSDLEGDGTGPAAPAGGAQ